MADAFAVLLILAVSAFAPPLVFLARVRRAETWGRESLGRILRTFLWGAVFAVLIAGLLELVLYAAYQEVDRVYVFSGRFPNVEILVLAVLIAPVVEEAAKGGSVYLARSAIAEPSSGLVYGAAGGFGFAATENLMYGFSAFLAPGGTLATSLLVIFARSLSSALLHASSTAAFGYGIALRTLWPSRFRALPYYGLAVVMHASYNLLASLGQFTIPALGDYAELIGFLGAVLLAGLAYAATRIWILRLDRGNAA